MRGYLKWLAVPLLMLAVVSAAAFPGSGRKYPQGTVCNTTVITRTSGTTFSNSTGCSVFTVEIIASGGGAADRAGPCGGSYAKVSSKTFSAGPTFTYSLGAPGAGSTGGAAGTAADSWFRIDGGVTAPANTTQGVLAKGGVGDPGTNTAPTCSTASIGDVTFPGSTGVSRSSGQGSSGAGAAATAAGTPSNAAPPSAGNGSAGASSATATGGTKNGGAGQPGTGIGTVGAGSGAGGSDIVFGSTGGVGGLCGGGGGPSAPGDAMLGGTGGAACLVITPIS